MRRVLAALSVTTAADVVDENDSVISLREAIELANSSIGPDTITFDPAVFGPESEIDLLLGQLDITDSVTITGPSGHPLAIDAQGDSRVIGFFSSAGDLTLEGLVITGGQTTADDVNSSESGGAIRFASAGALTLNHVTVIGNHTFGSDARGGAIFTDPGNVVLNHSLVSRNSTSGIGAQGGGIFARTGTVSLIDSAVSGNSTEQSRAKGGGIASGAGEVSLLRSSVTGNRTLGGSADGGGVFSAGGVSLDASVVSENTTTGQDADGGGMFANGIVNILRSDVSGNLAEGRFAGGGAIATDMADVMIEGSSITNNRTTGEFGYGGGLFSVRGNVTISQSTISGNTTAGADADGGGVNVFFSSLSVTASTITLNSAAAIGGGFAFTDNQNKTFVIQNSIVAGNNDSGTAPDFQAPPDEQLLAVESSLIGDNTGTTLEAAPEADSNGNFIGDPNSEGIIDPILDALTLAGTTRVHPLLSASVAVNAGNNSLAIAVPNDQRGEPFVRIADSVVDMGSFELQAIDPTVLVVTTATDELDFSNATVSLREAIVVANGNAGADVISFDPTVFATANTIDLLLGELTITESLSINGPGQELLSIDGQGDSRVMTVADGNANVALSGLTIKGGLTTAAEASGGGIRFLANGALTLRDSVVDNSHTRGGDAQGGGIYSLAGTVILDGSYVTNNSTSGSNATGGGVHSGGGLVAINSTIFGNTTSGAAAQGGGVFAQRQSGNAIQMTRSIVSDNSTTGTDTDGGGIATGSGAIRLSNSTVSQNTAMGDGGGIFSIGTAVASNHQIVSSTIARNSSGNVGGGISMESGGTSSLVIYNSIVATNTDAGSAPDLDLSRLAGDLNLESSLIGDNTGTSLAESQTADSFGNLIGAPDPGAGIIDPMLGPLGFRGGVTESHSLLPGSPAINAGTSLLLAGATRDQRGTPFLRVFGGAPDMGSFETQSLGESFFVVNTNADELNFANSELSLREALDLADGSVGADTIRFDTDIFSQPSSIDLVLGELRITDSVTILGPGRDLLTINGQENSRLFHIAGGTPDVVIDGFTITGGRTSGDNESNETTHHGGAIRIDAGGTHLLRNVTITGNRTLGARAAGGAIFLNDGTLSIESSIVGDNATEGLFAHGGGIHVTGGTLLVSDSTISSNATLGNADGGGISVLPNSNGSSFVTITRSTISGNQISGASSFGGGIAMSQGGDLTISQCVINGNHNADFGGAGGGVFFRDGMLSITESRIEANELTGSSSSGGGIQVFNAVFNLTNSSVTDNLISGDESDGAGMRISSTDARIVNSTISGNQATGNDAFGGAISSEDEIALEIVNTTITNNTAALSGGGIAFGGGGTAVLSLQNSIVAGNADSGVGTDLHAPTGNADLMFSLLGDNTGTDLAEAQAADAMGNLIGSASGSGIIDPMLSSLAINGGTTLTRAPLVGSPVIDAGNDALAVDANSNALTSDQRGAPFSRFSGTVDIGSFEVQPPREPIIEWPNPDNIFVGTELSDIQLNAATNAAGTFTYTPDSGTILNLGDSQTLIVQFTPNDTVNYATTVASVTINVVEQSDLGDAPDSYATLRSSNGPRHFVGSLTLGTTIDAEVQGQPGGDADGDGEDDDGVTFITSLLADASSATTATVNVNVSATSKLDAWIDFDRDGTFDHPNEHIGGGTSITVITGDNIVPISIPAGATAGETYVRFRVSNVGGLRPTGAASNGEVEDYAVTILDGADAPAVNLKLPSGPVTLFSELGQLVVQRRTSDLFRAPVPAVGRYEIIGDEFSNVLTIDTRGGAAIPSGGLSYDGTDRVNTVRLVGANNSLDLSRDGNVAFQNIDVIDTTDPAESTLTIDARAARAMDPTGGGVIMVGGQGDRIEFVDGVEWRMAKPIDVAGFSFSVVTLGDTFVQVDFASGWQNLAQPSDVNNDGNVTAGDALRIINELARRAFSDPLSTELDNPSAVSPWPNIYFDQNGDGLATALDALRVINQLARQQNGGGAGEGESQQAASQSSQPFAQQDVFKAAIHTMAPEQAIGKTSAVTLMDPQPFDSSNEAIVTSKRDYSEPLTESIDQLLSDRSFIDELSREIRSDLLT